MIQSHIIMPDSDLRNNYNLKNKLVACRTDNRHRDISSKETILPGIFFIEFTSFPIYFYNTL